MKNKIVERANTLNEFFCDEDEYMSLNELRFFCMYLSKLNAREPDRRTIEISISEFESLFEVKFNTTEFTKRMKKVLKRSVTIEDDNNYSLINLYSKFEWKKDEPKVIVVSCNSDILPYLFQLHDCYTSYRLENIAKLTSVSKIRLYEILKQYQNARQVQINVSDLQKMLMSTESEFKFFKLRVIEPAIKDINKYTDLNVTYEKILKNRKVIALKFTIKGENKKFKEIAVSKIEEKEIPKVSKKDSASNINDCFIELYERYFKDRNFKKSDTETIIIKLTEKVNSSSAKVKQIEEIEIYLKNLMAAYDKQRGKKTLENKVGYILGMIEKSAFIKQEPEYRQREEQSYDINEFEKYAINYEELKKVEEQSEDVQCNPDAEEMTISESDFKAETLEQFFERVGYKR